MKRLLKKAEVNYNDFLYELLNGNNYSQNEIDKILNANRDCTFNSEAYRVFYFNRYDIEDSCKSFKELYKNGQVDELNEAVVKDLIKVNNEYQSFAKSMNGIDVVHEDVTTGDDFCIIIKANIQNGLDIKKLVSKHGDDEATSNYDSFESEEEVLAKFNGNYEIVEAEQIYDEIYDIVFGDEIDNF